MFHFSFAALKKGAPKTQANLVKPFWIVKTIIHSGGDCAGGGGCGTNRRVAMPFRLRMVARAANKKIRHTICRSSVHPNPSRPPRSHGRRLPPSARPTAPPRPAPRSRPRNRPPQPCSRPRSSGPPSRRRISRSCDRSLRRLRRRSSARSTTNAAGRRSTSRPR